MPFTDIISTKHPAGKQGQIHTSVSLFACDLHIQSTYPMNMQSLDPVHTWTSCINSNVNRNGICRQFYI